MTTASFGPDRAQQQGAILAPPGLRPRWREGIGWLVSVALVAYIAWFLFEQRHALAERLAWTWWHVVLLAGGTVATWIVTSLQILLPLRELGARIGFWENLLLTAAAGFGNYLPMRAGTVLRMHYLKSVYGVGYLQFGGLLGVRTLLLLWSAGFAGLCGAAALALTTRSVSLEVLLLFGGLMAGSTLPVIVPASRILPSHGLAGRISRELTQAVAMVQQNRRMTALYLLLVALQFMVLTGRLWVAFDIVQLDPPLWVYCFVSPVATVLAFVGITPGNVGVREWVIGLVNAGLGIDYAATLAAVSVDGLVLMVVTLGLGGLASVVIVLQLGRRQPIASPSQASGAL